MEIVLDQLTNKFPITKYNIPIICKQIKPEIADKVKGINEFILACWAKRPLIQDAGINPDDVASTEPTSETGEGEYREVSDEDPTPTEETK